jgi:hypothetical protein
MKSIHFHHIHPSAFILQPDFGAGDEIRTRDPQLGRLMLYQLSYTRPQFGIADLVMRISNPKSAIAISQSRWCRG